MYPPSQNIGGIHPLHPPAVDAYENAHGLAACSEGGAIQTATRKHADAWTCDRLEVRLEQV
jgi:hypothetical protein